MMNFRDDLNIKMLKSRHYKGVNKHQNEGTNYNERVYLPGNDGACSIMYCKETRECIDRK